SFQVVLEGGAPWGFRLQGGLEFAEPITIAKVNPNSKAGNQGIKVGDCIRTVNGRSAEGLPHKEALQLIRNANSRLSLQLHR
ncbi:hypothetical protein CAPTEDRAFT_54114, partial [Capitella teleta]